MTKGEKREAEELKAFHESIERMQILDKALRDANVPADFAVHQEAENRLELWKRYSATPEGSDKRKECETYYRKKVGASLFYNPQEKIAAPKLRAEVKNMSDLDLYKFLIGCNSGNPFDRDFLYSLTGWGPAEMNILENLHEKWLDVMIAERDAEDAQEVEV
jgi:hypothetical protein